MEHCKRLPNIVELKHILNPQKIEVGEVSVTNPNHDKDNLLATCPLKGGHPTCSGVFYMAELIGSCYQPLA